MSKYKQINCICGDSFPIKGENNIGEHALVCPPVLERKEKKKAKQSVDKAKEMEMYTNPNSGIPPCMCLAKYEETRQAFSLQDRKILNKWEVSSAPIFFIDFPNFPTGTKQDQREFWRFLHVMDSKNTRFRIYLKFINKKWLLSTMKSFSVRPEVLKKMTFYIVDSAKAPVSRDDILMLKHISLETGNVVIPTRDSGEKYRDLGYHLEGKHIGQCRADERFGGTKQFKWVTYKIVLKDGEPQYAKIANHNCSPKEVVVTGFNPVINFVHY